MIFITISITILFSCLTHLVMISGFRNKELQTETNCSSLHYHRPKCIDLNPNKPNVHSYGCHCGPGYIWNKYTCVSQSVNSYLVFQRVNQQSTRSGYDDYTATILLDTTFPVLPNGFTITMWIALANEYHEGTVLSYRSAEVELIRLMFGGRFEKGNTKVELFLLGDRRIRFLPLKRNLNWFHFTWTWRNRAGRGSSNWALYLDGKRVSEDFDQFAVNHMRPHVLPSGGELVLGQAARVNKQHSHDINRTKPFNSSLSFSGWLSNVNIWDYTMSDNDVLKVYDDCEFHLCGNAVQWVDFRAGISGATELLWPSSIPTTLDSRCLTLGAMESTCGIYCLADRGAVCKEAYSDNIKWPSVRANNVSIVKCPAGQLTPPLLQNVSGKAMRFARRPCSEPERNVGRWLNADITTCISHPQLESARRVRQLEEQLLFVNQMRISGGRTDPRRRNISLRFGGKLVSADFNLKSSVLHYRDIISLAQRVRNISSAQRYLSPIDIASEIDVLGRLVSLQKHSLIATDHGVNKQRYTHSDVIYPSTNDTLNFARFIGEAVSNLLNSRNQDAWSGTKPQGEEGDRLLVVFENFTTLLAQSLQHHVGRSKMSFHEATISHHFSNLAFKVRLHRMHTFPGAAFPDVRDVRTLGMDPKRMQLLFRKAALTSLNITGPVDFAISFATFHRLAPLVPNHNVSSKYLDRDDNVNSPVTYMRIHFLNPNLLLNFSVPVEIRFRYLDWNKGEVPPPLLTVPSYIGLSISGTLHFISIVALLYYRTKSTTANIHKNFSIALLMSELVFMFGIEQFKHQTLCNVMAILLHFFVMASFCWLMNEGFNLYIVITYAAHQHGEHQESGSMWRFYLLGWAMPIALVGAFVGTHMDDYYAPDMCWIRWTYLWLFLGPPTGVLSVTFLVLIFTAKEHKESSYTKNEKTNKIILNHTKAMWTQLVLLTVDWLFAFISIKMRGEIIKVLYMLLNVLQGAFFFVFYVLLNEEVRSTIKKTRKKRNIAKAEDEAESNSSEEERREKRREKRLAKKAARNRRHSRMDMSKDANDSDCEVMITSV